jgi:hypothetical protein
MSQHEETNRVILNAVGWGAQACQAIQQAGGNPNHVLSQIPQDVIAALVRTNLHLIYKPEIK